MKLAARNSNLSWLEVGFTSEHDSIIPCTTVDCIMEEGTPTNDHDSGPPQIPSETILTGHESEKFEASHLVSFLLTLHAGLAPGHSFSKIHVTDRPSV